MEGIAQDIRFGVRTLAKAPAFATAAVLSIALGIGANTAIFSLIDAVMWRMLPVKDPEGLLAVVRSGAGRIQTGFEYKEYKMMREHSQMADVAAYAAVRVNVSVDGSVEPTADAQIISGNYLSLLGVIPAAGRAIGLDDDRILNGHPVAMISYGYWSRRFGLAPSVVGGAISIAGKPFTIIGVTPKEFFGAEIGTAPDIFVPLMMQPTVVPVSGELRDRNRAWCLLLARLKPGVHRQQASAELEGFYSRDQGAPPNYSKMNITDEAIRWLKAHNVDWQVAMIPAASGFSALRQQFSQTLFILMAAVGVVLLIACANTASLLLARAAARRSEFTMRLTLGASRARLIGQLIVESVMLAAAGGACGILLARWATKLLVIYMSAGRSAIILNLNPDIRVLSFTVAVSVMSGVLFGLAPALRSTRIDLAPALKGAGNLLSSRGRLRLGNVLAVFQVALSLLLLVSAGLFVRSLRNLHGQEVSSRETVLTLRIDPSGGEESRERRRELDVLYRDLIQRVKELPGVLSVGMAEVTPTNNGTGNYAGIRLASGLYSEPIGMFQIYPGYFASAGIPLIAGRDLIPLDLDEKAQDASIVNETLVRKFYPTENPIGKTLMKGHIVGVVKDSRMMNATGAIEPMIYTAYLHSTGRGSMVLYIRTAGNPNALLAKLREEARSVDKAAPQFEVRTLAQEMDAALIQERLIATLSGLFAVLALLLACVGLYGLFAFAVVQRTGEVGIRMALGAPRGDVLWMILRESLQLALAGIAIGVPIALAASRFASSRIPGLLFELKPTEPPTVAAAVALLLLAAGTAAFVPARRASRVDPMVALRNE